MRNEARSDDPGRESRTPHIAFHDMTCKIDSFHQLRPALPSGLCGCVMVLRMSPLSCSSAYVCMHVLFDVLPEAMNASLRPRQQSCCHARAQRNQLRDDGAQTHTWMGQWVTAVLFARMSPPHTWLTPCDSITALSTRRKPTTTENRAPRPRAHD